ncbi:MAG: c-type cytochrome [Casimicrobiaceae bacterium]
MSTNRQCSATLLLKGLRWFTGVAFLTGVLRAVSAGAMAGETPPRLEAARPTNGRAVYEQFCASCHGARGEGAPRWQSPDRNGEMPAPPHEAQGHTWKHSDAMLYRIVQQGWRDPFNKTDRLTMPAFEQQLSAQQTIAVITYVKTLWRPEQRQFQAEESRSQRFPQSSH